MENSSGLVQVLVAIAASGVLGAVINGLVNRRKLGADATKIITDAAASVTDTMQKRLASLESKEDERDAEEVAWRFTLAIHAAWDRKAIDIIRTAIPSADIDDPPPLYPSLKVIAKKEEG